MLGGVDGFAGAVTQRPRAPISEPDQPTRTLRNARGDHPEAWAAQPISTQARALHHLGLQLGSFEVAEHGTNSQAPCSSGL